jgi:tetratricopeptide (TPR) repeat protein
MNTRYGLGFSVASVAFLTCLAPAHAAVTVIGGGMAKECYEAVEYGRIPAQSALEICDKALEHEDLRRRDRAATFVNRGILHMREGRNERAMWDYEKSIDLMPDLQEAKVNLGAALYALKRYPEALAALNEGVKTDSIPARSIGLYNRGLTHEQLGNVSAAYYDYKAAAELDPLFVQASKQLQRFQVVAAPG